MTTDINRCLRAYKHHAMTTMLISGQVITVAVSDIIDSGLSKNPIPSVASISQSDERGDYDLYRGE